MFEAPGVRYRTLRMPFYTENLLHQVQPIRHAGTFFVPNAVDRPLLSVATRDVADAAAALLLDDSWTGRDGVPVVGPDDLSPTGMAAVVSEVLGRGIRVEHVPAPDHEAMMTQRSAARPRAGRGASSTQPPPRTTACTTPTPTPTEHPRSATGFRQLLAAGHALAADRRDEA